MLAELKTQIFCAYRDNPGWYHGAAFNSSSSSTINGGTLLRGITVGDGDATGGGSLTIDCSELDRRSAKCFALFSVAVTETLLLLRMLLRTEFPLRSLMIMTALSFLRMLRLFRLAWNEGGRRGVRRNS